MPGSMRLKMRGGKKMPKRVKKRGGDAVVKKRGGGPANLPGFKKGDVVCGAANRRRARQGANVNKK